MATNQELLAEGLELYRPTHGSTDREKGMRYEPKVVFWQGEWYTLPTIRHRRFAKHERQPKRQLRRQRRRAFLREGAKNE